MIESTTDERGYVIGGYSLGCTPEYFEGKLDQLFCGFGKNWFSTDKASGSNGFVSNIEVYNNLVKGHTKKFGKPKIEATNKENKFGRTFVSEIASWTDKIGNKLLLVSLLDKTDEGMLVLYSAKRWQNLQKQEIEEAEKRNF
jgi:hypothetical protein